MLWCITCWPAVFKSLRTPVPSWSFEPDTNDGKPRLVVENQALHASLSHTRGAAAVAISRVAAVGMDVETIMQMDELDRVAEYVLSDRERHVVER
jgi:phosphopantetheinyl transferase